jgi:hypothetical protein
MSYAIVSTRKIARLEEQLSNTMADLSFLRDVFDSFLKENISSGNNSSKLPSPSDPTLAKLAMTFQTVMINKKKIEDQHEWINIGMTKVIELLRASLHKSLDDICNDSIVFLTKYINANQGGLFLLNNDNPEAQHLSLKGMYAYNKRKHISKEISVTEGLLGECLMGASTIYMTDVPKNYVQITSGLGEATPTAIILIPLITNDTKIGVIELAAFSKYEPYQILFLEKVAETIAGMLLRKNEMETTSRLLRNFQNLSHELEVKEKVLQQNIEELQSIRDELSRQNHLLESAKRALENKNHELEERKKKEAELLASQLSTQGTIHQKIIERLKQKIAQLEEQIQKANESALPKAIINELYN